MIRFDFLKTPYFEWSKDMKIIFLDYVRKYLTVNILFSDDCRPIKGTSKKDVYCFVMMLQQFLGTNIISGKDLK